MGRVFVVLSLAALAVPSPQSAPPLVHPSEYRSESGRYVFEVDPSDRYGRGLMQCRLMRGKSEVWRNVLPWTAAKAGVANDGAVVAYSNDKCLRVIVLDPSGDVRGEHELPHTDLMCYGPMLPCARGEVLVDDSADLAYAKVYHGSPGPFWFAVRLSTGERVEGVEPARKLIEADEQRDRRRDERVSAPPAETIHLEQVATVSLYSPQQNRDRAIRDVVAIGFTDEGYAEFIRLDKGHFAYVRLSEQGLVDCQTELHSWVPISKRSRTRFFDLAGDRWLVQSLGEDPCWTEIDVVRLSQRPAPLPCGGADSAIAPLPDGSYLALVNRMEQDRAIKSLHYVRTDGTVEWEEEQPTKRSGATPFGRALYSARDIAYVGARTFVLLGNYEVTTIDFARNVLGSVRLSSVMNAPPYSSISVLTDGIDGIYLHKDGQFWHVSGTGAVAGALVPTRVDDNYGWTLEHFLRIAPDGHVWTSDGARLYRLNQGGKPDLVLGDTGTNDSLAHPQRFKIDGRGRILIRDGWTQATHVFDSNGERRFICPVESDERIDGYLWDSLRVTRDGSVWVSVRDGVVQFDPHGERVSKHFVSEEETYNGRRPKWARLAEFDADERALRSILRRPDNRWIAWLRDCATLPDGRRVLLEAPQPYQQGPEVLHFYANDGAPIESIEVPGQHDTLCVTNAWIVVSSYGKSCVLVRLADKKVFVFEYPVEDAALCVPGLTADGKELLLLNKESLEILRFDLH